MNVVVDVVMPDGRYNGAFENSTPVGFHIIIVTVLVVQHNHNMNICHLWVDFI